MLHVDLRRAFKRLLLLLVAAPVLAAGLFVPTGFAHEGHDHGPAENLAAMPIAPRVAVRSDVYELVGILKGDRLVIYLDRVATNEPVTTAKVAVTVGDSTDAVDAEPSADGTYAIGSPRFRRAGQIELVFAVTGESDDDLLAATLTIRPSTNETATDSPPSMLGAVRRWLAALFGMRSEAEDASLAQAKATIVPAVDAPRRRPDGHVFAPKPTQRLLEVRTERLEPQSAQRAVNLIGRIIADPNRTSLVQSINGGRVMAPQSGLPRIGQKVGKGDVLASIEPTVPQADRTTILEKQGEVEQLIAVAESRLRRLRLLVEKQAAPQSQVADAEVELEGLRRRQQVLRDIRIEPEILRAQTDGVIASARVVPGQVVQGQDVLFQIVDPASVWVEALVYGDLDPAAVGTATASAPGRAPLTLRFRGFSRALQQHATIVHFAVENPPANLSVGLPVTVNATSGEPITALIVPKESVVRGSNGEQVVWIHEDAELFEPRAVRIAPFDASRVLIAAGVSNGDRVVVRAAGLVNQVR